MSSAVPTLVRGMFVTMWFHSFLRVHAVTIRRRKRISKNNRGRPARPGLIRTFAQEWSYTTNEFSNGHFDRRNGVGAGEEAKILTTRDGVAGDTLPSKPTAHGAREVMETGFAGAVGVGFMVWDHNSFNRTNLTNVNEHDQYNTATKGRKSPTLMIRAGSR